MTAPQPATPLPWTYVQHNGHKPEKFGGAPAFQPADVKGRSGETICSFNNMPNDAPFIAHAANSYYKLVKQIRAELIETDYMMAGGSNDIMEWQDKNRQAGDRMRALLRELGEL